MAYQVSKALGISKTFKVLGNCHCFHNTNKLPIRKFLVHLNGPTDDLPRNEAKENRNHLSRSSSNLEI